MTRSRSSKFLSEEDGQDLVEYSIFLALMGFAAFIALGMADAGVHSLWANFRRSRSKTSR